MKMIKTFGLLFSLSSVNLVAQHLPLAIGNEWHYVQGLGPVGDNISTAVDTSVINGKTYFRIERKGISNPIFDAITYDRIEGDSFYYRIYGDQEQLIFNFNWMDGHVEYYPELSDSFCSVFELIHRDTATIWNIKTDIYYVTGGGVCSGQDTSWSLSSVSYIKYFGAMDASDGRIIGAKINGIMYGNLHPPIPVELLAFSNQVIGNSAKLNWSTASETNNHGFEIIRNDNSDVDTSTKIGFVKGRGTTTEKSDYEFWDKNLREGVYNYEVIQVDFDGTRKKIAETKIEISNPTIFSLGQNYPNPFNPVTNIDFSIPLKGKVELNVYNALGEKAAVLVNEEMEAGHHLVAFDASDLLSGVYFYRIIAGEFMQTKKLIVLK